MYLDQNNGNTPKPIRAVLAANTPDGGEQAASISTDVRAAHTAEIGAEQGASPSNTAPNNSKEETSKEEQPFFQALRWGVDSLYVSYKGKLTLET
jgi:hypothetical protein